MWLALLASDSFVADTGRTTQPSLWGRRRPKPDRRVPPKLPLRRRLNPDLDWRARWRSMKFFLGD